jgi:hypothetical protein
MIMKNDVPGIIFEGTKSPIVDSDNAMYYLEYDKTDDYFGYYDNEIKFYKGVEKLVRKHDFIQRVYPKYLKEIVGLKTCQVLSNIESDDKNKVKIEMHHGPILTLFDTCEIVTKHLLANNDPHITTPLVANIVVEQHRLNNVRVLFLAKSVHDKVHEDGIYINYNQGFGDTLEFLETFKDGVDKNMRMKINEYIAWSLSHDSTDSDIFALADTMREWGNNDYSDAEDIFF